MFFIWRVKKNATVMFESGNRVSFAVYTKRKKMLANLDSDKDNRVSKRWV